MKRVVCIVVAIFLLVLNAFGYADTEKDILFRNIPWGINIDEVKEALSDIDIWNDSDGYALSHWGDKKEFYFDREENGWSGWCFNSYSGEPLKVAGYPLVCSMCIVAME